MKNTQSGFMAIIIIVIVAAGLLGGGYYVSTSMKSNSEVNMIETDKNESQTQTTESKKVDDQTYKQVVEQQNSIITIQFKSEAKETDVLSLKSFLEKQKGVVSIEYTSALQGLADFKLRHKDDAETLKKLNELEQNPVGAKMVLNLSSSSDRETVLSSIKANAQFSIVETIK